MNVFRKWIPSEGHPFMSMPMLILVLLLGNVSGAFAYDWKGHSVDDVLYKNGSRDSKHDESDLTKVVFLQHVKTGKWLKPGGLWGTQPTVGDYATMLWICKDKPNLALKNYYFINTPIGQESGSASGSWIGYDANDDTDVDRSTIHMNYASTTKDSKILSAWNFVALGDNKYAISNRYPNLSNTLMMNAKPDDWYLCYDESKESLVLKEVAHKNVTQKDGLFDGDYNTLGDPDVDKLNADENYQWRIVTMQDIYDALNTSSADIDEPFDLTFLIKDSGLDRCNYYNKADNNNKNGWATTVADQKYVDTSATGLKLGVEALYSSELSNKTETSRYGGPTTNYSENADNHKKIAKEYGKYFCGRAKGGANYDVSEKYFTQNITVPRTGWYRLSCQGFTDTPDDASYLYGSSGQTSYVLKKLVSIKDFDGEGEEPKDLTEAGKMFYKKQYTNTLYFYAKENELMVIGLKFKGSTSWTAFDDFRLAYCGEDNPELVLDETMTDMYHITSANSKYNDFKGAIMHLHRKLDANKWNTIVVPVDLTMGQCRDLFGNHTMIAKLESYTNGVMMFRSVEDDENTGDTEVVMLANTPYIIKPTISTGSDGIGEDGNLNNKTVSYVGETVTQDDGTTTEPNIQVTCTAPYGSTFVNKKVNKEQMEDDDALMGGAKTTVTGGLTFHGTLVKTFGTNATTGDTDYKMSLNDKYIVYNGAIYHVNRNNFGLRGLRGYFSFDSASSAAKLNKVTFEIDGITDQESEVTDIDAIMGDNFAAKQNANVYTLDGKLVSTKGAGDNLPKGVYIINGKKHIVK